MTPTTTQHVRQALRIAPLFYVADIQKAVAYYQEVLGFCVDRIWGDPPCFAMPRRDECIVMLQQSNDLSLIRPKGARGDWDAYVWVFDADDLFEEVRAKGAIVSYEPMDKLFYGNREFGIKDVDGHLIAFGHHIEDKQARLALSANNLSANKGDV